MQKIFHERIGLLSEDGRSIVGEAHERHAKGECSWCDYVRVKAICQEFVYRLKVAGDRVQGLYLWSLGTSMKDSKMNRKLLLKRWRDFSKNLHGSSTWKPVFRVVEVGRRGYLHIHAVNICFCEHSVILRSWRLQTREKSNVHVSSWTGVQDPRRLAKYLVKYLTKEGSTYRWMGAFYGLGRERSRAVRTGTRKEAVRYGGVMYGGYWTIQKEERVAQQHLNIPE